jgi:hypothetical protein
MTKKRISERSFRNDRRVNYTSSDIAALSTHKMSNFLFEEKETKVNRTKQGDKGSVEDVISNLEQASESLKNEIDGLERVNSFLGSNSLKTVTDSLNKALIDIQLAGRKTVKQDFDKSVMLTNSVTKVRQDIKVAVDATLNALDRLGVPKETDLKINEFIPRQDDDEEVADEKLGKIKTKLKVKIDLEKFKEGIINKMSGEKPEGFLAKIMFAWKNRGEKETEDLKLNIDTFANDVLNCSPKNLVDAYKPLGEKQKSTEALRAATVATGATTATGLGPAIAALASATSASGAPAEGEKSGAGDVGKGGGSAPPSGGGERADAGKASGSIKKISDIESLNFKDMSYSDVIDNLNDYIGEEGANRLIRAMRGDTPAAQVFQALPKIIAALKKSGVNLDEASKKSDDLVLERLNVLAGTHIIKKR